MSIEAKQLSADELATLEEEWRDSHTVNQLFGHIRYLTDALIAAAGSSQANLILEKQV